MTEPVKNVATVYLSKWPVGSDTRRTMCQALNNVAHVLVADSNVEERVQVGCEFVDWGAVRYDEARTVAAKLAERELAPSTINKALVALRGVLEVAWRLGQIPDDEYRRIKVESVKGKSGKAGRPLDNTEIDRISMCLGDVTPRDAAMIALIYATGMRRIELVRLRREDYDGSTVKLTGKGNKVRVISVAPEWRAPIDAWWMTLGKRAPAFLAEKGQKLARSGVNQVIERFCALAKITPFTPHDLRRNYATRLIDAGIDLITVRDLMGHSSLDTTAIYDKRGDEAKRKAVEVLTRPKRRK